MRKNAALEASNVAVLLEHIPVGQTRSVHSLQVTRVEPDHYSIGGGRVVDLVDAISQIGQYTGHGAANMRSNPSTPKSVEEQGRSAYMRANVLLQQLKDANYKQEGYIEEVWHPIIDDLDDAARSTRIDPKVKRSAAAMLANVLQAIDVYEALPSEREARGLNEEYLEPHMRIGQRRNPPTAWHLDTAMQYLDKSQQAEQAGDLWAAYDFATMGISEVTDVQQHTTKMWDGSQYVDQPLDKFTLAKANERLAPLLEQQRKLKAKLQPALRSNPQKAERGYFYEVLDKRGDVVMLTTTKAEAEEICADPAAFKLRKGGTFTLRHVGARSALEGPPIKRI